MFSTKLKIEQLFIHFFTGTDICSGTHTGKPIPNVLQETSGVILTDTQCGGYWGTNYQSNPHICIHNTATGTCQVSDCACGCVCPRRIFCIFAV